MEIGLFVSYICMMTKVVLKKFRDIYYGLRPAQIGKVTHLKDGFPVKYETAEAWVISDHNDLTTGNVNYYSTALYRLDQAIELFYKDSNK